ncbi:MAG: hypothetical protein IK990_12515 [Ruminiclostridium sp.]|nr:hypothetical protein [Ruminiclostridium sp.]
MYEKNVHNAPESEKTVNPEKTGKRPMNRSWELAACAFLFGVAMIIIGVFL